MAEPTQVPAEINTTFDKYLTRALAVAADRDEFPHGLKADFPALVPAKA